MNISYYKEEKFQIQLEIYLDQLHFSKINTKKFEKTLGGINE